MLIAIEGFEGFTGGDSTTLLNGNLVESGSALSTSVPTTTGTRFSYGRSMIGSSGWTYRNTIATRTKVFQGVAMRRTLSNANVTVFEVYDGATLQCWLEYNSTNRQFNVYRGSGTGNLIAQTAINVAPSLGSWFYVEWSPVIHPSAGTADIHINGTSVLAATTLNTRASANNQITVAAMRAASDSAGTRNEADDYYLFDDQGSANNTFNGDTRIYTLFPDTDNSVQFTPNTGSVNADNVDDLADIDDDTTYNFSSTVGHIDSFNIEQMPASATVQAIEVRMVARKDDAGTRTARSGLERASNVANGTTRTLGTSYAVWADRYEVDPTDSSALTAAKVNAMHLRNEVVS